MIICKCNYIHITNHTHVPTFVYEIVYIHTVYLGNNSFTASYNDIITHANLHMAYCLKAPYTIVTNAIRWN